MTLQEVLERLDNVQNVSNGQWRANCPACGDRHQHLYLSSDQDGRILAHCKKGCSFDEIVTAMGLHKKQMFAEKPKWEPLREHIYRDGNDVPVAKKEMLRKPDGDKTAIWYRFERGRWVKGLNKIKVPLYHLKAMVLAAKVYLVEGEKDVETMERLGFTATTSPNGAGSKFRNDFLHYFRDKDVVILADNDATGKDYAKATAEKLRAKAKSVKMIPSEDIWSELKQKGDISDICDALGDEKAKELLAIAESRTETAAVPAAPVDVAGDPEDVFSQLDIDPGGYAYNDEGNAALFNDVYRDKMRFSATSKEWYIYADGRWQRDTGGMYVRQWMKELHQGLRKYSAYVPEDKRKEFIANCGRLGSKRVRDTVISDAQDLHWFTNDAFDKDLMLFNCKNCTISLKDGQPHPHDPRDMITRMSNVIYDPRARSPLFEQYIDEIMSHDGDKKRYLQKALGYALTGETKEECFFILFGATTRNGKGTLMSTISYMMGDGYAATAQPETFTMKRNRDSRQASGDIARLAGVRFLNVSEPDRNMQLDIALVKTLTGRDKITARHLHEREFEFEPQFKLFINTNFLPRANDDTLFSSGRVKVIPFERHFEDDEQDHTLKDRLRTPENISGIFNWCLEGLMMYREEGLKVPLSVSLATQDYRDKSDKLKMFIRECLEEDVFNSCTAKDAYIAYKTWCTESGYKYENKTTWLASMRAKGIVQEKGTVRGMTYFNVINGYKVSPMYMPQYEKNPDSHYENQHENTENSMKNTEFSMCDLSDFEEICAN